MVFQVMFISPQFSYRGNCFSWMQFRNSIELVKPHRFCMRDLNSGGLRLGKINGIV